MKTIYFVRHGESQANADGLLAGCKTDSPLTAKGEQQAHDLAQKLAGKKIELVVSSPLERAAKTAEIIAHDINYPGEIVLEPLFTERDFGSASGIPRDEGHAALDNGTATGVESVTDFADRVRQALDWLSKRPETHILIASHAAFGQMFGTVIAGQRPEDFLKHYHWSNGEVLELTVE